MKRHTTIVYSTLLALCMFVPSITRANTRLDAPQDGCLTWTLVGSSGAGVPSGILTEASNRSAHNAFKMNNINTPARLGFYLGPSSDPPVSIVGQDYRQDLASRIKYGFYLVSTF